jgi:hypothetical protein
MPASFREVWPLFGVDEKASGGPAMIVPVGGSNDVKLLWGAGLQVVPSSNLIHVQEIDLKGEVHETLAKVVSLVSFGVVKVDTKSVHDGSIRQFRITASRHTSTPVWLLAKKRTGSEAQVQVAALDQRIVKLAIRPVVVDDGSGKLVQHSKAPFDATKMVEQMNSIWTPQANVAFKLVSSNPAPITEYEVAKMLDLKMTDKAPLPDAVDIKKFTPVFERLKISQADLTMFLVKQANDGPKAVYGVTDPEKGFSLIGDDRAYRTMAHEAGHFLGSFKGSVNFVIFPDKGPDGGLMSVQKAGLIVPFEDVIKYFNPLR